MENRSFFPALLLGLLAGMVLGAWFLPRERLEDTAKRIAGRTMEIQKQARKVAEEITRLPGRLKKEAEKYS